MEKIEKDILNTSDDLKKMPFTTPEGYFEGVNRSVMARIAAEETSEETSSAERKPLRLILAPYLSLAAMFAVIVCAGSLFLKYLPFSSTTDEFEDMAYLDIIPVTEPDMIYYAGNYETEYVTEEDIAEYLIYSGVDIESFETE